MAKDQGPKTNENPLAEVAKTIGSTLGNAANRASEMLRDVLPSTFSEKLGIESAPPKTAASSAQRQSKPRKQAARKTRSRKAPLRKAVAKKKAARKPAAKKKASRSKAR